MIYYFIFLLCLPCSFCLAKNYPLSNDPVDVVVPCIKKDLVTLDLCIAGIREHGYPIRRIIVVSPERLTEQAEWFDEALFPFSKEEVTFFLWKKDLHTTRHYLKYREYRRRINWCYQQLLKLYASFVIPDLSPNVLVLDADTIFLNPVCFLDDNGGGLYAPGFSNHWVYYEHANRCLTGLHRIFPEYSGIAHHMLFQLSILKDLFFSIEQQHQKPLWQVFCFETDPKYIKEPPFASEYEIYFNFAFARTDQVHIRLLKWTDVANIDNLASLREQGYHYVSNHSYMRHKK
jgi:Family of unknown function (DUF6492)